MTPTRLPLLLTLLPLLAACSTGGDEDRPVSEVTISASHNMYGFGGSRGITEFPIPTGAVNTDRGLFTMLDSGGYTVTRGSSTSGESEYRLGADSLLYVREPAQNTWLVGAYQQADAGDQTQAYYFTDRFATAQSNVVGLYWGTRTVADSPAPDAIGDWYLFTQHMVFSKTTVLSTSDVGRSLSGRIAIALDNNDPSKPRLITGTGTESTGLGFKFTGTVSRFSGGVLDVDLDYENAATQKPADSRLFRCGHAKDVILGVDEDKADGEVGLVAMLRRHVIKDRPAAQGKLAGEYHFGMHTIFVAPTHSGVDAANGTIVFNDKGGWFLEGVGSQGPTAGKFDYSGSYEFVTIPSTNPVEYDSLLELTVSGTKETWYAAVDPAFATVVLVDPEVEQRNDPELNIVLAVRIPQ